MLARSHFLLLGAMIASYVVWRFSGQLDPYYLDIVINVGINIILAVSLNLINGYTGQFSLGHAGFMAVGAYTSATVTMFLGPRWLGGSGSSLLFLPALTAGGLAAAVAGLMVGVPSLRLKGDYLAIVTLGFGEIIRVIFRNMESVGGALGLQGIPAYTNLFWTFTFAALTIYVVTSLVNSTYGRGFIAVHDDEVAASAMGVNTVRLKLLAFAIGAFLAGAAGTVNAHFGRQVSPESYSFLESVTLLAAVVLGGMGTVPGALIGSTILILIPEKLRAFQDPRLLLFGVALILMMRFRPEGFVPSRRRQRELHAAGEDAGALAAPPGGVR